MDKFEFDVFLLRDAMLALHMPSLCVHLCSVDLVYRGLSEWTHLQCALHSYHTQQASPFSAVRGGDADLPK